MAKTYRYYFSEKMKKVQDGHGSATCHIMIDGKWVEYTERTTKQNASSLWDDLICLGEFDNDSSKILINGVVHPADFDDEDSPTAVLIKTAFAESLKQKHAQLVGRKSDG